MLPDTAAIRAAQPIWISIGEFGFEITDATYSCRARVDLVTLELLSLAQTPMMLGDLKTWLSERSELIVNARLESLLADGFLVEVADKPMPVWWDRWGPEARQLDAAAQRVRFLEDVDEINARKAALVSDCAPPTEDREPFLVSGLSAQRHELPDVGTYWGVINRRRSMLEHSGIPVTHDDVVRLISATFAVTDLCATTGLGIAAMKRYASSGGRHELVAFAVDLRKPSGPNVYRYDDLADELENTGARINLSEFNIGTGRQKLGDGASAGIVIASDFERASWKYRGVRGYQVALINSGFAGQLLLQNASALKMTVRITGNVDREILGPCMGLSPNLVPLLAFAVSGT